MCLKKFAIDHCAIYHCAIDEKAASHLAPSFLTPFRGGPGETQSIDAHDTQFAVKRLFTRDWMNAAGARQHL